MRKVGERGRHKQMSDWDKGAEADGERRRDMPGMLEERPLGLCRKGPEWVGRWPAA